MAVVTIGDMKDSDESAEHGAPEFSGERGVPQSQPAEYSGDIKQNTLVLDSLINTAEQFHAQIARPC